MKEKLLRAIAYVNYFADAAKAISKGFEAVNSAWPPVWPGNSRSTSSAVQKKEVEPLEQVNTAA